MLYLNVIYASGNSIFLTAQFVLSYDITIIAVYDLPTVVRGLVGRVASPDHTHFKG